MFSFPGQRPGEKILMVIRKHAIVYARIIAVFLLTVISPLLIFLLIWFNYYPINENYNISITVGLFCCIYLLYGLLLTCIAWINEEFDLFILTNERLIDITQVSFLKRTVASTPLNQIQDATSNVDGIFATLFNYGDIEIQTAAGDASLFFIDRIPDAAGAARSILDHANESRRVTGHVSSI